MAGLLVFALPTGSADATPEPVADQQRGGLRVVKTVSGDQAEEFRDHTFTFRYACSDRTTGSLQVKGDGVAVAARDTFADGTTCTVTEFRADAHRPGYTLAEPAPQQLTIVGGEQVTASFDNAYTRDTGTFQVTMEVTGDNAAQFAAGSFTVDYVCGDLRGSIEVPGDGSTVTGPPLPVGASCLVSEDRSSAERDGYSVGTLTRGEVFTVGSLPANVTITNHYTQDRGGFTLTNALTGDAADFMSDRFFVYNYSCGSVSGTAYLTEGESSQITNAPDGTCTITQLPPTTDAPATHELTWGVDGAAKGGATLTFEVRNGETTHVLATNQYTAHKGTFAVSKNAVVDYNDMFVPGMITVEWQCFNSTTAEFSTGSIQIPGDGTPVTVDREFSATTDCAIEEIESSAQRDGYHLYAEHAGTARISSQHTPVAVVTNRYYRERGSFTLTKHVTGDAADRAPEEFTFTYNCGDGDKELTVRRGVAKTISGIPTGMCTITEHEVNVAGVEQSVSISTPQSQTSGPTMLFRVRNSEDIPLNFVNDYSLRRATFQVSKTVRSDGALEPGSFAFNYSCTVGDQQVEGTIQAPGDGTPMAAGQDFPVGTTCVITEDASSAQRAGYTVTVPQPQTITIVEGEPVTAEFENLYQRIPAPEPSAEPTPQPSPEPSATPSADPSAQPTPEPTPSPSPQPSPEPSATPSADPSAQPTPEPTPSPSPQPSPEPSATPSPEPSAQPTPEPTPSPSAQPSAPGGPTPTQTAGSTPEPTAGSASSHKTLRPRPGLPKTGV